MALAPSLQPTYDISEVEMLPQLSERISDAVRELASASDRLPLDTPSSIVLMSDFLALKLQNIIWGEERPSLNSLGLEHDRNAANIINQLTYYANYLIDFLWQGDINGFYAYFNQLFVQIPEDEWQSLVIQSYYHLRAAIDNQFETTARERYKASDPEAKVEWEDGELPDLKDLKRINLFEGFRLRVVKEGQEYIIACKVLDTNNPEELNLIAALRQAGYSKFDASVKKGEKVLRYKIGPQTIISLTLQKPSGEIVGLGTAEVMIDTILGTEGERLTTDMSSYRRIDTSQLQDMCARSATSLQYIEALSNTTYLPGKFVQGRSFPSRIAGEVGSLSFNHRRANGELAIGMSPQLQGEMIFAVLAMSASIVERWDMHNLSGIFQPYLKEILDQVAGASVIIDPKRRLDILGINNIGPDANGTAANINYFISHATYFFSGSSILIPSDLTITTSEGNSVFVPAGSYLKIGNDFLHTVSIKGPEGKEVWKQPKKNRLAPDHDMLEGLGVAQQILRSPEVRKMLITKWEELLLGEEEEEGHITGPGFYRQTTQGIMRSMREHLTKKKLKERAKKMVTALDNGRLQHYPDTSAFDHPDIESLNRRNRELVANLESPEFENLLADLYLLHNYPGQIYIRREISPEVLHFLLSRCDLQRENQLWQPDDSDPDAFFYRTISQTVDQRYLEVAVTDFSKGDAFSPETDLSNYTIVITSTDERIPRVYIIPDKNVFNAQRMIRAWAIITKQNSLQEQLEAATADGVYLSGEILLTVIEKDPFLRKLRNSQVAVVGQGTAGYPTTEQLARLGVENLTLYEITTEKWSLPNVQRVSNITKLGLPKLITSASNAQSINPLLNIDLGGELSPGSVELLKGMDVVVLAADVEAQIPVHLYCYENGIDVILGTDIGSGGLITHYPYSNRKTPLFNGRVTTEQLRLNRSAIIKLLGLFNVLLKGDPQVLKAFIASGKKHLNAAFPQSHGAPGITAVANATIVRKIILDLIGAKEAYIDPERESRSLRQRILSPYWLQNLRSLLSSNRLTVKNNYPEEG